MKANPKNFTGWKDPDGGEWIKVTAGYFKDTLFRPANMKIEEDGKVTYQIEFFGEAVEAVAFDKMANSIVQSILYEVMDEKS